MLREFVRRLPPARVFLAGLGLLVLTTTACIQELIERGVSAYLGDALQFGEDPGPPRYEAKSFVNWETPHVSPLALTPGGATLLAVNTPAARLEVLDVSGSDGPTVVDRIPVGLDPVSVRARTDTEAWVVNHVSDSVSVVDLARGAIVRTLHPGDEPTDVAFAQGRAFVVCSQINTVVVYELADLSAPPVHIPIAGDDPRAIAVSPDGNYVFIAIFESGNQTTVVPFSRVVDSGGPYGGRNPPPNAGAGFDPPAGELPPQAPLSQIVRKDRATGRWLDDNGGDWSAHIEWDLHDHDVAIVDARSLEVSYVAHLMNLNMHLAALPDGRIAVVGTEADNHVRFEPNLTGRFVRSRIALVDPRAPRDAAVLDLNPHLAEAYAAKVGTFPPELRSASIADPRGVVFAADGQTGYVAGMGSNTIVVVDGFGHRLDHVAVGQGPTGLSLDERRGRLYVYEKFDAAIRVIDTSTLATIHRTMLPDPTPPAIRAGRPLLYDAHATSGLGVTACASCHVDGRMDPLAWDLGDPSAGVKRFNQYCDDVLTGRNGSHCVDFHPIKGPMLTQSLQGIIGQEPLHWRGDRENLAAFKPAYVSLLGNDREPTDAEMGLFQEFLATIVYPPNPYRNLDNSLRESLGGANPLRGRELFLRAEIDDANGSARADENPLLEGILRRAGAVLSCNRCHQLPAGTNRRITSNRELNLPQGMKVPQLRTAYERTGFSKASRSNDRGFGYSHDGSFDSLDEFLRLPNFHFGADELGERNRADVIAFVMSMGTDTHAGVGLQTTLDGANHDDPLVHDRIDLMLRLAESGQVGLVVHGLRAGRRHGFAYRIGGLFESADGTLASPDELRVAGGPDEALTWTIVPVGSERRLGLDE